MSLSAQGDHPGELSRAAQDCVPAKTWFCLPGLDCVQLLGTLEFVPNPILSICISLLGGIWLQWFPAMPLQSRAAPGLVWPLQLSEMPPATQQTPDCPGLRVTTTTWEGSMGFFCQGWFSWDGEEFQDCPTLQHPTHRALCFVFPRLMRV